VAFPPTLFRVEWYEGFGWPECERRERTHRTYESLEAAMRMVDTIRSLPDHHALIGVWRTDTEWQHLTLEDTDDDERARSPA